MKRSADQCCNYGPVAGQSGRLLAIQEPATFARLLLQQNLMVFYFGFPSKLLWMDEIIFSNNVMKISNGHYVSNSSVSQV